jgi:hypothetical protein
MTGMGSADQLGREEDDFWEMLRSPIFKPIPPTPEKSREVRERLKKQLRGVRVKIEDRDPR